MKSGEILKDIMSESKITQTQLAKMCGYASPSGVHNMLDRDANIKTFAAVLDNLGYEIVVRRKRLGDKGEKYIIDPE